MIFFFRKRCIKYNFIIVDFRLILSHRTSLTPFVPFELRDILNTRVYTYTCINIYIFNVLNKKNAKGI